jgi:hypothetical protein
MSTFGVHDRCTSELSDSQLSNTTQYIEMKSLITYISISDLNMSDRPLTETDGTIDLKVGEAAALFGGRLMAPGTIGSFPAPPPDEVCRLRPPRFFNQPLNLG